MSHNALLNWQGDNVRYATLWCVGSEGDNGEHIRYAGGWPYSVFRMGLQPGVTDHVLCHGIQDLDDVVKLCDMLNAASVAAIDKHTAVTKADDASRTLSTSKSQLRGPPRCGLPGCDPGIKGS